MKIPGYKSGTGNGSAFRQAQTAEKFFKAKLAKLNVEEREGLLVRQSDEKEKGFAARTFIRESIFNLIERMSSVIAAETDAQKIRKMLGKELNKIFQELAGAE